MWDVECHILLEKNKFIELPKVKKIPSSCCVSFCSSTKRRSMHRRRWQSVDVRSGWVQVLRGPRPPWVTWPAARDGTRAPSGRCRQPREKFHFAKPTPELVVGGVTLAKTDCGQNRRSPRQTLATTDSGHKELRMLDLSQFDSGQFYSSQWQIRILVCLCVVPDLFRDLGWFQGVIGCAGAFVALLFLPFCSCLDCPLPGGPRP